MSKPINQMPHWPDARGWIGLGIYAMSIQLLWMFALYPELRQDEFFKTIGTLVIGTGFVNGVVSWAYSATKTGGEAAESSARIAEQAATAALPPKQPATDPADPQTVTIEQPKNKPIPTTVEGTKK